MWFFLEEFGLIVSVQGSRIKAILMDKSHQLYLFIVLTITLFTDINPTGDFQHSWFDAQNRCVGRGLTIERVNSDQPYWTGRYRRVTPWINILGCYPDNITLLQDVVKNTMILNSIGMCQEICNHEKSHKFAIKMNECLCIKSNTNDSHLNRFPASDCTFICGDNSDDIYSGECGGKSAYNIYETQGVNFNSTKTCLSLQCSPEDQRFIPQKCSDSFAIICENMTLPDSAKSWSLSMEQCKKARNSTYLLGDIDLTDPHLICSSKPSQFQVFWVGVARQVYTSIDQGQEIRVENIGKILECQRCERNTCYYMGCSLSLNGSIFCKSNFNTSKTQITEPLTTSQESFSASTLLSTHSTAEELFISTSTAINHDTDQLPSTTDTQQMPSASDELTLKIALPLTLGFIVLSISAVGAGYCTRFKATKADRITKAKVESRHEKNIGSSVDSVQNSSYFVLEQCPQYISKGSYSSNESPYNNSEEGVYDHLRDKISRKPEVEDTYQHASAGVSSNMSEYDTMANAFNKKQEECYSDDYSHQDSNGNYACDLRANNHLTHNPYDVAV
nr:uncharacterized protein LOC109619625 isoform X2 [Crassostrea gigas]